MVYFVTFLQTTQNTDCIFYGRFCYHDRLETSLQCRVLLDILSVLIQCGSTDTMQFTSCQHRLEHIACIQCTVCFSCANNGMQLINEQNDLTITVLDILQYSLQSLFKFTTIFRTCYQCAHIQCKDFLIL